MKQKIILLPLFILISILSSNAQDTLKLVSGKNKVVKVAYETSLYVFYHHIKNNDTTQLGKKKMIDKEDVFQISYLKTSSQNNKIVQVYQQDSLEENYLSIPEMNEYLAGRQQAYKNYKSFKYAALGFVGGLGSGYLGPFWGFLPVSVYTGVSGLWSIKTFYKADHPEDFNSPFFTEGYRQVTYSKQVKNSAIGSLAGLAISIATFQLILR